MFNEALLYLLLLNEIMETLFVFGGIMFNKTPNWPKKTSKKIFYPFLVFYKFFF